MEEMVGSVWLLYLAEIVLLIGWLLAILSNFRVYQQQLHRKI